jgi:methionyl-tRNA formyltransferase
MDKKIRIVLFTRIKPLAGCVLEKLNDFGLEADAVFIEKRNSAGILKRAKKILKYRGLISLIKEVFSFALSRTGLKKESKRVSVSYYRNFCSRIFYFEKFNSMECIEKLKEENADVVIVAGAGILSENLIKEAKKFFLNAHPGLLPYYRGVDVLQAAVLNGDEPYVTLHQIDAGVDTGSILGIEKIPLEKGDTFNSLREKSIEIAGKMIAETVVRINNGEPLEEKENNKELGRQFYMMTPEVLKKAEKKLKNLISRIDS